MATPPRITSSATKIHVARRMSNLLSTNSLEFTLAPGCERIVNLGGRAEGRSGETALGLLGRAGRPLVQRGLEPARRGQVAPVCESCLLVVGPNPCVVARAVQPQEGPAGVATPVRGPFAAD